MFADKLSEIHGTERLSDHLYFNKGLGIRLSPNKIARYPEVTSEITDKKMEETITKRNSLGYRSDEFFVSENSLHVVFSGCSTTYGSGLSYNDTWAKRVYDGLSEEYSLGPYINLARGASSLFNIISEIFKYIEEFGKPDIIALSFPSIFRGYKVSEQKVIYNSHLPNWFDTPPETLQHIANNLLPYVHDYLMMLTAFCKTNSIKLYMFTWEGETTEVQTYSSLEIANQFIQFKDLDRMLYNSERAVGLSKEMFANDGAHLGNSFHSVFAERVLKQIKEDLSSENSGH